MNRARIAHGYEIKECLTILLADEKKYCNSDSNDRLIPDSAKQPESYSRGVTAQRSRAFCIRMIFEIEKCYLHERFVFEHGIIEFAWLYARRIFNACVFHTGENLLECVENQFARFCFEHIGRPRERIFFSHMTSEKSFPIKYGRPAHLSIKFSRVRPSILFL